jgi:hypothetical protein
MRGDKPPEINCRLRDATLGLKVGVIEGNLEIGEVDQGRFAAFTVDECCGGGGKLLGKRTLARRTGKDQNAGHMVNPDEGTDRQNRAGGLIPR